MRIPAHLTCGASGVDEAIGGDTTTVDVSGGGIQITDPWNLPLGLDVRVELRPSPATRRVNALGRVVRVAGTEEKGDAPRLPLARADEERLMRIHP